MVKSRPTISDDVDNAARLEEHARNVMATNQRQVNCSMDVRYWSVITLACIGALASACFTVLALWPLAKISYKFWFPS